MSSSEKNTSAPTFPPDHLTWVERLAVRIGHRINRPGIVHKIAVWWGNTFTVPVLAWVTEHRWIHHHQDRLKGVPEDAPLLVVSNHRTFFDMYVGISSLRCITNRRLGNPAVFPVRSSFFYDSVIGVIINLFFSGGCMWPPVFRDDRKNSLNPVTIDVMHSLLTQEGLCFGYHPEGRRSKEADPYTLLPPKRGVGDLITQAGDQVYVLPLFLSGLSGDVKHEWRCRKAAIGKNHPLNFYWGEPKAVREYQGDAEAIARAVHQSIQDLGDEARVNEQDNQ